MRSTIATALTLLASPAMADAVTYRGDLDGTAIVLELSEPAETTTAELVGRYFYETKGIDIPLRVERPTPGFLTLTEESPCGETDCEIDQSGLIRERPAAATWSLKIEANGASLVGSWTGADRPARPLSLARVGTRPFVPYDPPSPADLAEFSLYVLSGERLNEQTSPYDFIKMSGPVARSDATRWGAAAFDYVSDPRTLFRYPRVTDLGGVPTASVNAYLEQRDWGMRLAALNCRSQIYPSMTSGGEVPPDGGSLGGFDEETIAVQYLSPTLLTFTESGSLFCGSAYPENHYHAFNIDIATGKPLDLSRLFKGWVARDFATNEIIDLDTARQDPTNYSWGPDQALADYIIAKAPSLGDTETDEQCGYPDLVRTNLTIAFRMPDHVVFGLDGLPHVIQACAQDLYEAPIGELKGLLLAEANTYFPALAD
jgi:hypothetical protein